nr:hypothetical protein CFP56_13411 [Quercus suber]
MGSMHWRRRCWDFCQHKRYALCRDISVEEGFFGRVCITKTASCYQSSSIPVAPPELLAVLPTIDPTRACSHISIYNQTAWHRFHLPQCRADLLFVKAPPDSTICTTAARVMLKGSGDLRKGSHYPASM